MKFKHVLPLKLFDVYLVYFKNLFFQSRFTLMVTLVSCCLTFSYDAYAAPQDKFERSNQKKLIDLDKKSQASKANITDDENESFFFKYTSSISFGVGGGLNFEELNKTDGDKKVPILFGFKYMLNSENSKHQEYGLDLLSSSKLYVHGGYKYIIDHTSKLRPYYKFGAAMRFDPGDHLETPFDFKSYSLMAALGIEDSIQDSNSLRADLSLLWGKEDFIALLFLGWSFAF